MENNEIKQQVLHIIGNVKGGVITPLEAVELIHNIYTNGKLQ
jgi:hypothetical protein